MSKIMLPTASGLPDRFPIRSQLTPPKPEEEHSRITRQHTAATVQRGPYKWVEPFTWRDGARYGEGDLQQQFVTNVAEIPHLLGVLQEDVEDSSGLTTEPFYVPVFSELSVPIGPNETWYFIEVIRFSGTGTSGTHQIRFGWYTPLGWYVQGTGPVIDGNGNSYYHEIDLNATLPTQLEWESSQGLPAHQSGLQRVTWMDFYVTSNNTSGNLDCGFSTVNDGVEATVYAGSCIMGMRLNP